MRAHDDHRKNGDDESTLDDQGQARGLIGQGSPGSDPESVQCDEHHRLQRDTAEDVADGGVEMTAGRRTVGDGNLRQIGRDRQDDQATEGVAEMQTLRKVSVFFDKKMPATQMAIALATKIASS